MLDIDFFKNVNDTFGHMIGDDALRAFAQRVREHLRQGDVCARFGGEEFVVVLPRTTLQTALEVAERLRMGVEKSPLLTHDHWSRSQCLLVRRH
jgi:diguanylate cyclase (GGDEF)-like protein